MTNEPSPEQRLDKIANDCLEMLGKNIENERQKPTGDQIAVVRRTGEALKALAEGIEAYKKAMTKPEIVPTPKQ
jgi:hypothetical protein